MSKAFNIELEFHRLPPVYNQGRRSKTGQMNYQRAMVEMIKHGVEKGPMKTAMVVFTRHSIVKMSPENVKSSMSPFLSAVEDLKFAKKIEPVFKWEKGDYGRGRVTIEIREL
jgi:hypothetical protein